MSWELIVTWIQIKQWRLREEYQFKVSLEVELTGFKLETKDEKDSDLKACSSISGLNVWVNGGAIVEKGYNIFWGRFYNSVFHLSISKYVLTIYAVVPNMCFAKNCDRMRCYPTCILFRYMITAETQVTWVREKNFLLIISSSTDKLTLQCISPTCIPTGSKKRADGIFLCEWQITFHRQRMENDGFAVYIQD